MPVTRRPWFRIGAISIGLLWAGVLLGWSYCWGWIGRRTAALQYFVRPLCPASSAEARYPDTIDVAIPAELDAGVKHVSPNGRYVLAELRGIAPPERTYLYDVHEQEYERTEFLAYTFAPFVTENWIVTLP